MKISIIMTMIIIVVAFVGLSQLTSPTLGIFPAFGHGVGYEVLPPVMIGNRQVSLEVISSQYDTQSADREITFALFDTNTGITIEDVTYRVKATKGGKFLFEETFQSNDGIIIMNLVPSESWEINIEKKQVGLLESILGGNDEISFMGKDFITGGLYKFGVDILTIQDYSNQLEEPVEYNVGLSIPDRTYYNIEDPNFGPQQLAVTTYYDQINNFRYEPQTRSISFEMPFEWNEYNINQTSVVHEEIIIPKTFGDLMISDFSTMINDSEVLERVTTIDDFSEKTRIIHIVLNQNDLLDILRKNQTPQSKMEFSLKPSSDNLPLSMVTGNGQFRITLSWDPPSIKSGKETIFFFDITDVFLKDRPVAVSYDLSIIQNEKEFFKKSGTSSGSRDETDLVQVPIPEHVSGPVMLQFNNLDGNRLARADLPVVVDRIQLGSNAISIPDWVKKNAGWWSEGQISDGDFAKGIEFMIKEGIVEIPTDRVKQGATTQKVMIPDWVRNNASWWSEGLIADDEFASALQFLIKNGIVSVY